MIAEGNVATVARGERTVPRKTMDERVTSDFTGGLWRRWYSVDPVTGAHTKALHIPAGVRFTEKSHFCDSDHEIFMFEGGFDFDDLLPLREGDYLYRPAGTVYGDGEHTDTGGIQIISFGREKVSFHLDDPPRPWPGMYLVDARWSERRAQPLHVRGADLAWLASPLGGGIREKRLRGVPGQASPVWGSSSHSPWSADAAFLLRIPGGYHGPWPAWPGSAAECLVVSGSGASAEGPWERGCYTIGSALGPLAVDNDLVLYCRTFAR